LISVAALDLNAGRDSSRLKFRARASAGVIAMFARGFSGTGIVSRADDRAIEAY
jgi:hypothetical protein